ncbi:MAG: hypothetical protein JOZ64_17175 [Solirubrobacterales bacterium]|nr:hypothetical protein [Solirubrobacterales bacterium]
MKRIVVAAVAALLVLMLSGASAPAAGLRPPASGACNEGLFLNGGDPGPWLKSRHATVMKLIAPRAPDPRTGVAAVRKAYAEHYKVLVSIQFTEADTVPQIVRDFKARVPLYAKYAWAISVGNEADLRLSAAKYRQVWNAVEPVIHKLAPKALPVFGEVTPWGLGFMKRAWGKTAPRGVAAIAFHGYHTTARNAGLMALPQVAAWAQSKHVPLWDTESGPSTKYRVFLVTESARRFYSELAAMERRSPDLKLVVQWYWPQVGSL